MYKSPTVKVSYIGISQDETWGAANIAQCQVDEIEPPCTWIPLYVLSDPAITVLKESYSIHTQLLTISLHPIFTLFYPLMITSLRGKKVDTLCSPTQRATLKLATTVASPTIA